MDVPSEFQKVSHAFPRTAMYEGTNFNWASRNGVSIVELKRSNQFFYWMFANEEVVLIDISITKKFKSMKTIGETVRPDPSIYRLSPA